MTRHYNLTRHYLHKETLMEFTGRDHWLIRLAGAVREMSDTWRTAYRILVPLKPAKPKPIAKIQTLRAFQIRSWLDEREESTGTRPTQAQAAAHFAVSKATVSRRLNGKKPPPPRLRLVG